jgi:hypothetical protein
MEVEALPAPKGRPREFCVDAALAAALRSRTASRMLSASAPHATELMMPRQPCGLSGQVCISSAPRIRRSATPRAVGASSASRM